MMVAFQKAAGQKSSHQVLLVEGPNDLHVISALLKQHEFPQCFEIVSLNGIDNLLDNIKVRLKARQGEEMRLAVIVDADVQLDVRWRALDGALRAGAGAELPPSAVQAGTIVELWDARRFGVWVMPDNRLPGILEDFVAFLVPEGEPLLMQVDQFLTNLPDAEACPNRFSEKDRAKARIHTYLAIQKEPGKPMGQAITSRYLDSNAAIVAPFLHWLRRMFLE